MVPNAQFSIKRPKWKLVNEMTTEHFSSKKNTSYTKWNELAHRLFKMTDNVQKNNKRMTKNNILCTLEVFKFRNITVFPHVALFLYKAPIKPHPFYLHLQNCTVCCYPNPDSSFSVWMAGEFADGEQLPKKLMHSTPKFLSVKNAGKSE